LSTNL